jgi:hypothetical protein
VIEKPNDGVRLVSNLTRLNDLAKKETCRLPGVRRIIKTMAGTRWFSVMDLKEGYYQIEIEEEHKHKTAFEFEHKVYELNGMVYGLWRMHQWYSKWQ